MKQGVSQNDKIWERKGEVKFFIGDWRWEQALMISSLFVFRLMSFGSFYSMDVKLNNCQKNVKGFFSED